MGGVRFDVTIDDPGDLHAAYHDDVRRLIRAAADEWARYLVGQCTIELRVRFDDGDGTYLMASGPAVFVWTGRWHDGANVWEAGPIHEVRTGFDPNGSTPDGELHVAPAHFDRQWWGYPDLSPPNLADAYSTALHELGHVLGFFDLQTSGAPALDEVSTFDVCVSADSRGSTFGGPSTLALFDRRVPVGDTWGCLSHVAVDIGPGSLMSGNHRDYATRLEVTSLELAMLADVGMPVDLDTAVAQLGIPSPQFGHGGLSVVIEPAATGSVPRTTQTAPPAETPFATPPTNWCGLGVAGALPLTLSALVGLRRRH